MTTRKRIAKPKKAAPTVRVWGSGLVGLWTPSGSITLPKGYVDVPTREAGLTRAIKLTCAASWPAKTVYLRMSDYWSLAWSAGPDPAESAQSVSWGEGGGHSTAWGLGLARTDAFGSRRTS